MKCDILNYNLSQFDQQLNLIKSNIIKLSEQNNDNNKLEKFLIDDTKVMALNDDLTQFNIIVSIKIGNSQLWQRTTTVDIDEKTKLIANAKIQSIKIIEEDQDNIKNNDDSKQNEDQQPQNILDAIDDY